MGDYEAAVVGQKLDSGYITHVDTFLLAMREPMHARVACACMDHTLWAAVQRGDVAQVQRVLRTYPRAHAWVHVDSGSGGRSATAGPRAAPRARTCRDRPGEPGDHPSTRPTATTTNEDAQHVVTCGIDDHGAPDMHCTLDETATGPALEITAVRTLLAP